MYYKIMIKGAWYVVEESLYASFIDKKSTYFVSPERAQAYIDKNKQNKIGVVQ